MLILERCAGERIIIDHPNIEDVIVIQVVREGGGRLKLGITAPSDVLVDREEVYNRREADR